VHKTCANGWCKNEFEVTEEDLAFYEKVSPEFDGEKSLFPSPTLCPPCRQQRRIAFRNDSCYYKNTCTSCKKQVISIYSPDTGLPVFCYECFWSDQWNAHEYGREFDFTKTFLEQFDALKKVTPRLTIFNTQSENSDYTVHSSRNKNCYMSSSIIDCENVFFSDFVFDCIDCIDCFSCSKMELCSSCIFSEACYNGDFLNVCFNLTDAMFCFDCKGGSKLLGCVGRRNAKTEVLNKNVSEEEFKKTRN